MTHGGQPMPALLLVPLRSLGQFAVVVLIIQPLLVSQVAAQGVFRGLGDFAGGLFRSAAYDISDDGSAVVGSGWNADNNKAFRWTDLGNLVQLENSALYSHSSAISADGAVAVGWVWNQATARVEAFRWTEATGAIGLGDLTGGTFESYANDVSADGSVVVGLGHTSLGYQASRWTQATGQVPLGDLPGGIFHSTAFGVSRDGSTIVGEGRSALGQEAFRWTSADGMVGLGDLAGGIYMSQAEDVLANGEVVVGFGHSALGREAFRWTQATGIIGLGDLAGGAHDSWAWGGAADGSVVVGYGTSESGEEAFIWDEHHGMRHLQDVAESEYGLDLTGWTLARALGMSADGRKIVGFGYNPDGKPEAWVMQVPEPNTFVVTAIGGLALLFGRTKRDRITESGRTNQQTKSDH